MKKKIVARRSKEKKYTAYHFQFSFKRSSSISLNLYRKRGNWVWRWGTEKPNNIYLYIDRRCKCLYGQKKSARSSTGRPIDWNKLKPMEETNKITNFSMFLYIDFIDFYFVKFYGDEHQQFNGVWSILHAYWHTVNCIQIYTRINGEFPTLCNNIFLALVLSQCVCISSPSTFFFKFVNTMEFRHRATDLTKIGFHLTVWTIEHFTILLWLYFHFSLVFYKNGKLFVSYFFSSLYLFLFL